MKLRIKNLAAAALVIAAGLPAAAQSRTITINAPVDTIRYIVAGVDDYVSGDIDPDESDIAITVGGKAEIVLPSGGVYFMSDLTPRGVFIAEGEQPVLTSDASGRVSVAGSRIASQMTDLHQSLDSLQKILAGLDRESPEMMTVYNEYRTLPGRLLPENLDNPFGVYLLSMTTVTDADRYLDSIAPAARESFLAPLYQRQVKSIEAYRELQANKEKIKEGAPAPDITLPDMEGNPVSLSSFRGKWMLLDFWGSWCRWCMVGVPQMKENYAIYKDRCEFVGIDCREPKEAWIEAVKANGMDWTQLYNEPADGGKAANVVYGVSGYPTKILVDPKGVIAKVCVGEDPDFYNDFAELMK